MKEKLYTLGMIAKEYHISLKVAADWVNEVRKVYGVAGRRSGIEKIKDDPHGRWGIPEEIVKIYPKLPLKK